MTRTPWRLVVRHLRAHWLRTGLTVAAMVVALFLYCALVSIVSSMSSAVRQSKADRLIVQSAVSLYVSLPLDYQPKIAAVEGVESVSKFQWFGGYFKDPGNFFANFGVDHDRFFDMYAREFSFPAELNGGGEGEKRAQVAALMAADRRACVIGEGLLREPFDWKIGDTVPLTGTIFTRLDGSAWEFNVVGVYRALKANVDDRTLFFRYDLLDEALAAGSASGPRGVGTFAVNVAAGHDPAQVIAAVDRLFENGPQATRTSTEAAFQAGFVSMMGNLPLFLGTIGGAVVFAVFFSVVNTMLMAARHRVHEAGVLKAVGFSDRAVGGLLLSESLFLSLVGGGLGIALALVTAPVVRTMPGLGAIIPNYHVEPGTLLAGAGIALAVGLVAGAVPAWQMARLRPTEALRSEG